MKVDCVFYTKHANMASAAATIKSTRCNKSDDFRSVTMRKMHHNFLTLELEAE